MDRSERLIRSGLNLASDLSLETVLQRIVDEAADLTDATYGALGVLGPDGGIAEFVTTGITAEQRAAIGDPPKGHGILGLLIRDPRPVRIRTLAEHELSYGFPPNHPAMTSFLGAPVSSRGTVFGNLYLTNKKGAQEFGQRDEEALVVLAAQAGIAVENARLYAEARALKDEVDRLAILEDRERIAKDLHDGVIQSLFASGMNLQAAVALSDDPNVARRIEGVVGELDYVIRELRNYIFRLRPQQVSGRLDETLYRHAAEFEERTGIVTAVSVDRGAAERLKDQEADLVQIVHEALSNVGRHSGASTCRLSLVQEGDASLLEVDDDGRGFDPGSSKQGMGLRNLRERAGSLGGDFEVRSSPGSGTVVRLVLRPG